MVQNDYQKKYYDKHKTKILKRARNNKDYMKRQRDRNKKERIEKPWLKYLYNARTRCKNPNNKQYHNYGGRGIKCFLTRDDIEYLWFRDKAYEMDNPSIDRIDNNWHYILENCRFIEHVENIKKSNKDRLYRTTLDYSI